MGTHPIFESDFDCLTVNWARTRHNRMRSRERAAVATIQRAWLAHRDYQIYQILRAVVCVSEGDFGRILLSRLAPTEAQFLMKGCSVKLRLAGESFPPKVVFKVSLNAKSDSVCYLSGRRELKDDITGAVAMMGERNFCAQLASDLIERKMNGSVVDVVDVGTARDMARFKAYEEKSSATIGGKDNGWRLVDLQTIPRAAPFRDLFQVVHSKQLSHLPKTFWSRPRNREHLLRQIELLLADEHYGVAKANPRFRSEEEIEQKRQDSAALRIEKMTNLYLERAASCSTASAKSTKLTIVDLEPLDFDNEARELYEWSQYL